MQRLALHAVAFLVFCLFAAAPARAADDNAYAAGDSYTPPVVTVGKGDTLTFNNLDTTARHDLVADDGKFASGLIGAGEKSKVAGVEALAPGTYQFHCSIHSWMHGVLDVGAAGAGGGTPDPASAMVPTDSNPDPADIFPPAEARPLGPGSWRVYGKDLSNSRNGGTGGPAPSDIPKLGAVWSFWSRMGDFTGTPAVADGMVFDASTSGVAYGLDATTGKPRWAQKVGATVNGSVAVDRGRVFVPVAEVNGPRVVALNEKTGRPLWSATVDTQKDADVYGSPTVWNGTVYIGTSSEYGETSDANVAHRGSVVAINERTGRIRWTTYTVPPGRDGASVWTTPAIDRRTGRLYVGTGNAYHAPAADTTDSILALDARSGRTLGHYQASPNDVWNETSNNVGVDYDFGASPNLFDGPNGQKLVGAGQKAGDYHALDRSTLQPVWKTKTALGTPVVGGIIGSTATDGKRIYGPDTVGGESWALSTGGMLNWASADGGPLHFDPTTVANGVVYTNDMTGQLTARDASTGAVLGKIPLGAPSWGGVSVAGGRIFTNTGSQGSSGFIVSYGVQTGNEANRPANHWNDPEMPWFKDRPAKKHKRHARKHAKRHAKKHGKRHARKHRKKHGRKRGHPQAAQGSQPGGNQPVNPFDPMMGPGGGPTKALRQMADRWVPKPPGTVQKLSLYYGPFTVPPGQDFNRVQLDLPMYDGWLEYVAPYMRRVTDLSEPNHQEAHIHHAHWFRTNPGDPTDNYFKGNAEWIFGQGDEQTHADFRQRSMADRRGPMYGEFIPRGDPQNLIYMLHNKTNQPLAVYIVLDVQWRDGTGQELQKITGRPWHDLQGMLTGVTYDVPRNPNGDGEYQLARDRHKPVEWTSPVDGTLVGMGGHVHPGGKWVSVTNQGSAQSPCPTTRGNTVPGTLMIHEGVIPHNPAAGDFSEDYQTATTHPAWRAPIHKGDRIVIDSGYENRDHGWYEVMTHEGFYFDPQQPPRGHCKPYMVGGWARKWKHPTKAVPNRHWRMNEAFCGIAGYPPCDHPDQGVPPAPVHMNQVNIVNFTYQPGDRASSGVINQIPWVRQGEALTFVNDDWPTAGIRHSVTTCAWPCNGSYVSNYPLADGTWDSGTLGWDPISGGNPSGVSSTPPDLPAGTYSYFCRIHPWMRGAFEVVPKDAPAPEAGSPLAGAAQFVRSFGSGSR